MDSELQRRMDKVLELTGNDPLLLCDTVMEYCGKFPYFYQEPEEKFKAIKYMFWRNAIRFNSFEGSDGIHYYGQQQHFNYESQPEEGQQFLGQYSESHFRENREINQFPPVVGNLPYLHSQGQHQSLESLNAHNGILGCPQFVYLGELRPLNNGEQVFQDAASVPVFPHMATAPMIQMMECHGLDVNTVPLNAEGRNHDINYSYMQQQTEPANDVVYCRSYDPVADGRQISLNTNAPEFIPKKVFQPEQPSQQAEVCNGGIPSSIRSPGTPKHGNSTKHVQFDSSATKCNGEIRAETPSSTQHGGSPGRSKNKRSSKANNNRVPLPVHHESSGRNGYRNDVHMERPQPRVMHQQHPNPLP